ncbi:gamma-glutamyltransferase [Asaia lannensis]|uniref:Gamma-glutamyltransferase n=1 Tax=Asaia lannensis NBRC 102526 TaxID=1307926 RepID=A0ABT1CD81_9PROT|nr:gamma-glutamyltransferase [Asaia lannensis]MCO6158808.1 gamma-glutamyltransferase [Asaia lannensis NBRC 102526]GBR00174.1 gamma-glutamyltranspeptidase [Asaia lannensis NBRC 102526]
METPHVAHRRTNAPRCPAGRIARKAGLRSACVLTAGVLLAGCSDVSHIGHSLFGKTTPIVTGYIGTVVADEPRAALIGRDVLVHGGNAADAAAAVGMALSVTLPSRASLGGGGACLVTRANETPQAFTFLPASAPAAPATRQAALPMTPRGLFTMQLRYGTVEFADLLSPSVRLARSGTTVSRVLAGDIAAVQTALFADDAAHTVFSRPDGTPLQNGDALVQPQLASFLERMTNLGVGDLYNGALGAIFVEGANKAGGGLSTSAMRKAMPLQLAPLKLEQDGYTASFLPPPADGGIGAAVAFRSGGSAQGAVATWRSEDRHGLSSEALLSAAQTLVNSGSTYNGTLPALPASTSFVVTDDKGGAVACALTDNNLFGTGRMADGTGVLLAAAPGRYPAPLLAAAILQRRGTLVGAMAASGQNDAADAVAQAARAALVGTTVPHEGQGRVNASLCKGGECHGDTDPRGGGLSVGSINN